MRVGHGADLVHSSCLSLSFSSGLSELRGGLAQCTRQPSSCRRRGGSGGRLSCRGGHCERLFPSICRAAAPALTWGTGCLGRQGRSPEGGELGGAKDVSTASEAPSVKWAHNSPWSGHGSRKKNGKLSRW